MGFLSHFSFRSFILKYNTLYTDSSLGNAPFPRVTFLNAEFTDSMALVVYIAFLISAGSSNNGSKISILQNIGRSFLMIIPSISLFILSLIVIFNEELLKTIIDTNLFLLYSILLLSWYDMIFFTKDKILFHDFATKTRVVVNNPDTYYDSKYMAVIDFIFPNIKDILIDMKNVLIKHYHEIKNIFKADNKDNNPKKEEVKTEKVSNKNKKDVKEKEEKVSKKTTKKTTKKANKKTTKKSKK